MKRPSRLSASFVRVINQPGRYGDGRGGFGLSLLVKAKRAHRVPLSTRALQVLSAARRLAGGSELVFPSARGRAMGENTLARLCRNLNLGCVPHGMRSSFRDWSAECSDAPGEVCELALAHVNTNRVERAYRRTDLFERRRQLMEEWAEFLTDPG